MNRNNLDVLRDQIIEKKAKGPQKMSSNEYLMNRDLIEDKALNKENINTEENH